MRVACISDIHANLPALEAVLPAIKSFSPDLTLSLGDQIGFGPQPGEVLSLLEAEGIPSLMGNHEQRQNDYLLRRDPELETAVNFAIVRHTQRFIAGTPFDYPAARTIEGVTFSHSAPQDASWPLYKTDRLSALLSTLQTPCTVCGHDHNQWSYHQGAHTLYVTGSVGMAENGIPGTAQFTIVDIAHGHVHVMPQLIAYDPAPLYGAFIKNGFAQAAPIMSRLILEGMRLNRNTLFPFFDHLRAYMRELGLTSITPGVWQLAGRTFDFSTDESCEAFWRRG